MAKANFFVGEPEPHKTHYGLIGTEYQARDRTLTPAIWKRIAARAAREHKVPVAGVVLLWAHEFPTPYKDGSIGEVNVRYDGRYEAIYGLYADGHIGLWAD